MSDDQIRAMVENNIYIANEHNKIIREKTDDEAQAFMDALFESYEVVWGVWQKDDGGFDMFPLKGDDIFRAATEFGRAAPLKMTAIVCSEAKGHAAKARAARNNDLPSPRHR
ncbi:hypothetical protein [Tardiphaga sp. 841_E9_N1_2]|jgi:hypothetical protein|uniref:hypothetical protein n=1 Tax=Tardiphaga sp. 841_E9_N1_2 TaxID=3240762 RepID=UPI003F24B504